jgi:hypothetical protein
LNQKRLIALVALAGLLGLGGSAMAEIGAVDVVPAATLLLPRFEVDLSDPNGVTTLFSVNNASDESVIAHVTLWTELWIPILDFDVYLTGYDVQTMNLRDILQNGILPRTGTAAPTFPPVGAFSGPHPSAAAYTALGCSNTVGPTNYAPIGGLVLGVIQDAFTGRPLRAGSNAGDCASNPFGDLDLARGYATIDVVNICSTEFPSDLGYFINGGLGVAANDNVLWGDTFLVDSANNFAQGFTLVHIEADASDLPQGIATCDTIAGGGDRSESTFYCTITGEAQAAPGADNREPLPSVYGVRFLNGGAFTGGTDLFVWRDPNALAGFITNCTAANTAARVGSQNQVVVFDEQENPEVAEVGGPSQPDITEDIFPFPWCTNRTTVGGVELPATPPFGWLYLNLNNAAGAATGPFDHHQAYVQAVMDATGRFSVGIDAVQLNELVRDEVLNFPRPNTDPILGPSFLLNVGPSLNDGL